MHRHLQSQLGIFRSEAAVLDVAFFVGWQHQLPVPDQGQPVVSNLRG